MHITLKNGKHYLVGSALEVGRTLVKASMPRNELDVGWTLNEVSDKLASILGNRYACSDCSFAGTENQFPSNTCPQCGGNTMEQA